MEEQALIDALPTSRGEQKRELLLQLCEYRSSTADAFWQSRLKVQYLPYLCYSRSDAVSDHAARLLRQCVERLLESPPPYTQAHLEALFHALQLAAFKESPAMVEVLALIGAQYEALHTVEFDLRALLTSETLPPYLRRVGKLMQAHGCRTDFIGLLTELMVCTLLRSESFRPALTSLAERYPKAYGYPGFFAAHLADSRAALDIYAKPFYLDAALTVLGGLEQRGERWYQLSPVWFYGAHCRIWSCAAPLGQPFDPGWVDFLAKSYTYADARQMQGVSQLLFRFTELEGTNRVLMQEFFYQAALTDTSEYNLVGLMRCGGYDRCDALIQGICEQICRGRNHYHALFVVFELLDLARPEKRRLLDKARAYIEATDHRESWYAQRNRFLYAADRFESGETGELEET
ncbi:MAG: hypothetical protein IJ055_06835 [Oscillospiraceae bacterium]|nr:hypothetical protein [Oscillospiraceae bacterium]